MTRCAYCGGEALAAQPPAAPVDISTLTPNATTIAALQEAEHIIAAFKAANASEPPADQVEPPLTCPAIDAFIAKHSPDDEIVRELNAIRDINSHLLHGLWGEKQRSAEYYDYFEMLWNWFADESRRGAEDMRANAANGGLSADDFKQMLDDHETNLTPVPPQVVQVTDAMCEAAVKADQVERIQGFTYESHHVIRDVWKDFSEQKVWEIDKNDADAEPKFRHQCRIERMRKVLEAALALSRPQEK